MTVTISVEITGSIEFWVARALGVTSRETTRRIGDALRVFQSRFNIAFFLSLAGSVLKSTFPTGSNPVGKDYDRDNYLYQGDVMYQDFLWQCSYFPALYVLSRGSIKKNPTPLRDGIVIAFTQRARQL
jgi:hypothetical protein